MHQSLIFGSGDPGITSVVADAVRKLTASCRNPFALGTMRGLWRNRFLLIGAFAALRDMFSRKGFLCVSARGL